MQKALFLLLFFFINAAIHSQENEEFDFYKNIIETTHDKQAKLVALDSILRITWKDRNFIDFADYTVIYLDVAEELGEYDEMAKKAMNSTHPITNNLNNPELAIDLVNRAIKYESKLSDSFLKGGLYLKRGGAYYRLNTQKAIEDYTKALDIYEEKDAIYMADAYLFRGQAYSNQGLFVIASEDYKKAYDLYEEANDVEYMLHARSGEVIMYSKNGFIEKAINQREKLINDIKKLELNEYLSTHLYNQSIDYKKLENNSKRRDLLLEALKTVDLANNSNFMYTGIYSSLSEYYSLENDTENAWLYLSKAEGYFNNAPNDKYGKSIFLMAKIQYHIAQEDWNEAKELALARLEVLNTLGLDEETINTHKTLSDIYIKLDSSNEAYTHLYHFSTLKDSIFNQSKTNALIYYQTLYETERREKELYEKRSSIALLEEKNTSLRRQYVFGGITFTLGFILFFLFKNQRNLKQKKELHEKYTQDLLMAQEDERKRVSKDLHDGIGQSLLLIKNKVVLNKNDNTKSLVEDAIEEVRSISRALHPFQLQELGITKAIQNIIYQIDETSELFISSEIENIDGLFNIQKEVNIYRIIQESFNNIIKHSQATGVRIELLKNENQVKLTIKDNGKGFDFSEKYSDFKSLGLKTLKERTKLLEGILKIESQPEKGTSLEFTIPIR